MSVKRSSMLKKDLVLTLEMIIESGLSEGEHLWLCRACSVFEAPFVEQIDGDRLSLSLSGPLRTFVEVGFVG